MRDGEIVAAGVNTALRDADPTAHAEVEAIRKAGADDIEGAIIVASCEPCPMPGRRPRGRPQIVYAAPKELAAQAGFELGPVAADARPSALGRQAACRTWTPPTLRSRSSVSLGPKPQPRTPCASCAALTLDDYEQAVLYRDVLGLPVRMAWDDPEGSGTILEAGRATLELLSRDQADLIDRIEVGRRIAGPVRLALEVEDSARKAEQLTAGGAELVAPATETSWAT